MNTGFAVAAILSGITFCIHTFIGGKYAVRPLLAAVLSPLSVWVAMKGGIAPYLFPSSWLFAMIVAASLWGLFG